MKNKAKGKLYRSDNEFGTSFFYECPKDNWWVWIPLIFNTFDSKAGVTTSSPPFWMHIQDGRGTSARVNRKELKRTSKLEFLLLTGYAFTESAEWIE